MRNTFSSSSSSSSFGRNRCHAPSLLLGVTVAALVLTPYLQQPARLSSSSRNCAHATRSHNSYDAAAATAWVKKLAALSSCGTSKHGKRWRSLACVVVRNDMHMREFVVRNLLLGFCHIVISDNNQVAAGRDHNISLLLQPFVQQGLVTHLPYNADGSQQFLDMETKAGSARMCFQEFAPQADFFMDLDADEYLHVLPSSSSSSSPASASGEQAASGAGHQPQLQPTSVGSLPRLLDDWEQAMPDACALEFPWRMMYGEHLVLAPPAALLLTTFQRICFSVSQKVLLRTDLATFQPPHWAHCKDTAVFKSQPVDGEYRLKALPHYTLHLVHYYAKSVEEYLSKSEQSQPPYWRKMRDMYDPSASSCTTNQSIHFDAGYKQAAQEIILGLRAAQGGLPDAGEWLGPLPEYKPHSRDDYALYLFLKLRVSTRSEWDEAGYLQRNTNASAAVQGKRFVDGLHHFLVEGFAQGAASCWNDTRAPGGRAFCIS